MRILFFDVLNGYALVKKWIGKGILTFAMEKS